MLDFLSWAKKNFFNLKNKRDSFTFGSQINSLGYSNAIGATQVRESREAGENS